LYDVSCPSCHPLSVLVPGRFIFRDSISPWLMSPRLPDICLITGRSDNSFSFYGDTKLANRKWLSLQDGLKANVRVRNTYANVSGPSGCISSFSLHCWKKVLAPELGPLALPSLAVGTSLGKPPRKVFCFE
jgi:hypothetical protein